MTRQRQRALLAAVLCLYLALACWAVSAEYVWSNEAWFTSPAFTLIHKGYLGTTIFAGKGTWLAGIEHRTYWIPPLYLILEALWGRVFGFGLVAVRALSVLAGAFVLWAWYRIAQRLSGSVAVALLTVAIAGTDLRFLMFAAIGRPDMVCAALGTAGWAAFLSLRERGLGRAIVVGNCFAALACIVHPCGELYAAALLVLTLYFDGRQLRWRDGVRVVVPYVVALAGWGLYVMQAPREFVRQITGNIGGIGTEFTGVDRLAGLMSPLAALKREYFLRYGHLFGWQAPTAVERVPLIALAIYTAGVVGCLLIPSVRNRRGVRALVLVGSLTYVTMAIIDGFKSSGYLVHTMPMAAALLAICAHDLFTRGRGARWIAVVVLAVFGLVEGFTLVRGLTVTHDRWDYQNTLAFLQREKAPANIIAAGEFAFAYGFDSGLKDDLRLGYYTGERAPFIVASTIYRGWFQHSAELEPEVHRYMETLLRDEYRVLFQNDTYTVYRRASDGSDERP